MDDLEFSFYPRNFWKGMSEHILYYYSAISSGYSSVAVARPRSIDIPV